MTDIQRPSSMPTAAELQQRARDAFTEARKRAAYCGEQQPSGSLCMERGLENFLRRELTALGCPWVWEIEERRSDLIAAGYEPPEDLGPPETTR